MNAVIDTPQTDIEFTEISKLEAEKESLVLQAQEKDYKINALRRKLNQKLNAMSGFASQEESQKIIYTLNSYYKHLHGGEDEVQELINLGNIENVFTWLMAYNYMKVTNPELIEFEGEEKFVVAIYMTFHMHTGIMGNPKILAHANNKCLFIADESYKVPEASR